MPELVVLLVRIGLLTLLWLFVLATVRVVRRDLTTTPAPTVGRAQDVKPRKQAKQAKQQTPSKRSQARTLVVTAGQLQGTTLQLGETPVTVGRGEGNTLVLTDDYASTSHARIVPGDGAWMLEDLGSTNGTWLDRNRVGEPVAVPLGTPIRVGRTVLELRR